MAIRRISVDEAVDQFQEDGDVLEAVQLWAQAFMMNGRNPVSDRILVERLQYLASCIDQRDIEEHTDDYLEGA